MPGQAQWPICNFPGGGMVGMVQKVFDYAGPLWTCTRRNGTRNAIGDVLSEIVLTNTAVHVMEAQFELEEIDDDEILRTDKLVFVIPFMFGTEMAIPQIGDFYTDPDSGLTYEIMNILNQLETGGEILLWELQLRNA